MWQEFSSWLAETPFSLAIQTRSWAIPGIQSIHILAIAVVLSSALMFNLRLLGYAWKGESVAAIAQRFLRPTWIALVVLLVTGLLLVTAEPGRSITNPSFIAKMIMVVLVVSLNLFVQGAVMRNPQNWEGVRPPAAARVVAVSSLLLWSCITVAGRLIAYVETI